MAFSLMANIYIVYILKQVRPTRNHVKGIGQTDNYQHILLDLVEIEIMAPNVYGDK